MTHHSTAEKNLRRSCTRYLCTPGRIYRRARLTHHVADEKEQLGRVGRGVGLDWELVEPPLKAADGDAEHGDESEPEIAEVSGGRVGEEGHPHDRVCGAWIGKDDTASAK
jgi:hypothetical protein